MKVQAHSSLEPQLETNQYNHAFDKSRLVMTFSTNLGVTEILCSFRLVLEGEIGKEIPESLKLEFLEKFLANIFTLSGAEDNTYGLLNRGGMADLLLLKTLLVFCQKSQEPSFWELIDCFILLVYAGFAASRTLLQRLLAHLKLTFDSENVFCGYN